MLRKYKIHTQQNKVSKMEVRLTQVTACSSSAIGALILLADKMAGEFMVSLDQCNDKVHQLFDSGFLDRFLKIQHRSRSSYAITSGATVPLLAY
jgi:ABC-type transporter Mla MlaB component